MVKALPRVLLATLLVGTLDLGAAFLLAYVRSGTGPEIVCRYIASGILGESAFSTTTKAVVYGVLLHYLIAFLFTAFMFVKYPYTTKVFSNKWVIGIIYGFFIWAVMNFLVLPFSNIPARSSTFLNHLVSLSVLIVCIGIPLSLIANRYYIQNVPSK